MVSVIIFWKNLDKKQKSLKSFQNLPILILSFRAILESRVVPATSNNQVLTNRLLKLLSKSKIFSFLNKCQDVL